MIDDFALSECLSLGKSSRVFIAQRKSDGQYFALKRMKKFDVIHQREVERLRNERLCLKRVDHPFVVKLYDIFQDERFIFFLLDLCLGGDLCWHLRKATRFEADVARFYTAQCVLALQYLHTQGIVFRDLSSQNLVLDARGYAKFADFGCGKVMPKSRRTYTLCGSSEYIAPEIILGMGHDYTVDWWSLGVLVYEMIAGYTPFAASTRADIFCRVLQDRVEFPRHFDSKVSDFVLCLLALDPRTRLGNTSPDISPIKKHKWFKNMPWEALSSMTCVPPIQPDISGPTDTSNFDRYPESDEEESMHLKTYAAAQSVFKDF